jgi:hypothetical protein
VRVTMPRHGRRGRDRARCGRRARLPSV